MIDKDGNEYTEEVILDENGRPIKKIKNRTFRDKDGNLVEE